MQICKVKIIRRVGVSLPLKLENNCSLIKMQAIILQLSLKKNAKTAVVAAENSDHEMADENALNDILGKIDETQNPAEKVADGSGSFAHSNNISPV